MKERERPRNESLASFFFFNYRVCSCDAPSLPWRPVGAKSNTGHRRVTRRGGSCRR